MTLNVLVTGATGKVGLATLSALRDKDARVVAFVRDPVRAAHALEQDVELRVGDLADEASLIKALAGIDAVLLASGNDPGMREQQLSAARAIARSEVRRVVKISGSPVSIVHAARACTGADHLAVEVALRATSREVVAIRPNVFMQNFLDQAAAVAHDALPGPDGAPRVSFIDAHDIGRVSAAVLAEPVLPGEILEVTGPEALTWFDVAALMTEVLGRPITHYPAAPEVIRQGLLAMGRPAWQVEHALEFSALFTDPRAAETTDTVQRLTGRAPNTLKAFLERHAEDFRPVA
jgi:uncharacterized protein YbjT (DUF2867 family)